jgi:hypothetical protein
MDNSYSIALNDEGYIGYAVIINNNDFVDLKTGQPKAREGSEKDVRNVTNSLEKLKFNVRDPEINLTADQMREKTKEIAKTVDFNKYSCFVCVIMSHGHENDQICGVDNKTVSLSGDIVDPFRECRQLLGKPKLFFVQACRGRDTISINETKEDDDDDSDDDDDEIEEIDLSQFIENDGLDNERDASNPKISKLGDTLVHYATVEGFVAKRSIKRGSFFIIFLCRVLDKYALTDQHVEIDRLIRMVNHLVANKTGFQQPVYKNALNKLFFFNPSLSAIKSDNQERYNIQVN